MPNTNGHIHELRRHPPTELLSAPLHRLGEGIGKVVFASKHWVVKRERSPSEILALIVVWKFLRRANRLLPGAAARRLLEHPSRQLRLLRLAAQTVVSILPRTWWYTTHAWGVLKQYHRATKRGERLAELHLSGTNIIPETIEFPPTRVKVSGWPGYLTVSEATERVDANFSQFLTGLALQDRYIEIEVWLNRLLDLRQAGWSRGLFSVDSHLKNFGVIEDRVVLLDSGGLTDKWEDIERRLAFEDTIEEPHAALGLAELLESRPEIAARFNRRWKETVTPEVVRNLWPAH